MWSSWRGGLCKKVFLNLSNKEELLASGLCLEVSKSARLLSRLVLAMQVEPDLL